MKKFSIEKKGYNTTEVDDYLMSLEGALDATVYM